MKAAVLPAKGATLVIEDVPTPQPGPGEALVRLEAAALNRRDWWIQQGQYGGLQYPAILGSDGAGRVEAVGSTADEAWVGRQVIINPALNWGSDRKAPSKGFGILGMPTQGCLAAYVCVPESNLAPQPAHLSAIEAAALPLAGLTAFRAMFYRGRLQAGEKLLITGAGGGAAQLALHFGLHAGAQVYVTAGSEQKVQACLAAGAAGGICYKNEDWHKDLKAQAGGFDLIIDSAGGADFSKLIDLANDGGRIVLFGGTAGPWPSMPPQRIFWKQVDILGTTMGSPEDFADMLAFVNKHQMRPTVGQHFPLSRVNEAFEAMGRGDGLGKIVITIA